MPFFKHAQSESRHNYYNTIYSTVIHADDQSPEGIKITSYASHTETDKCSRLQTPIPW